MKVAVGLVACGRHELTQRAIDTFVQHNADQLEHLHLLLAIDPVGPNDHLLPHVVRYAERAGFTLCHCPGERGPQVESLRSIVAAAGDADWVLWLENDWETVAPLPFPVLEDTGAETVRLFGAYKGRSGRSADLAGVHMMGTDQLLQWTSSGREGWQIAKAHWGAGGTLIRTTVLADLAPLPRLKAMMQQPLVSLRPLANIMWNMGAPTTQGFMD